MMISTRVLTATIPVVLALTTSGLYAGETLAQASNESSLRVFKKGASCIEGNDVEGEGTSSYKATGAAIVTIGGQSSKLEADTIVYDRTSRTVAASGHARMFRNGSETKADSLKFVIDEPKHLVTEAGTVVSEPKLVKRRVPMNSGDASALSAPVDGPMLYQRQIVCTLLKAAGKAGLDVTEQVREFASLEEQVKNGKNPADFQAGLDSIRQTVSAELGRKQLLVDQYYGNGPLTKLCAKITSDLRTTWQNTPGFEKPVYLFFFVQPDGRITDVEMDNPIKYGTAVNAIAIKKVKSLDLSAPAVNTAIGARPVAVPIVLSLCNNSKETDTYVRHLNHETYLAATQAKMSAIFKSLKVKEHGKMTIRVLLSRDGTVRNIDVIESSWREPLKQSILAGIRKSGKVSPFPDGALETMLMEFTFSYNNHQIIPERK